MNQSTGIIAALAIAFLLFLAARNRLGIYAGVLWGNTAAPTPTGNPTTNGSSGSSGNTLGDIASAAKVAAMFAG